jgi:hypothetical protein
METPAVTPAVRKGFFRRLMSWRGALFLLAAFITFAALLLAEENWRGTRAWQNYKRQMEAKGERFDAARLIPPKVPDDENLATIAFFTNKNADAGPMTGQANQFEWPNHPHRPTSWPYAVADDLIEWVKAFRGRSAEPVQAASTVLDYLNQREPVLARLESVSQRPYYRFNIPYEEWGNEAVGTALLEHLARLKQLFQLLSLHAEAEMVSGRTDQALNDINVMFRIDDGLKDEPLLISQLVRLACAVIMLQPIGEGLAEHRWSEAQLRVLQERLQKTDLIASMVQATYGERDICSNPAFDRGEMFPMFLRGWNRLEQLNINLAFHNMVLPRIDLAARKISPSVNRSIDVAFKKFSDGNWFHIVFIQHSIYARMLMPAFSRDPQKTAFAQSEVDMAMLACALERYRLAQGQYPEELNALVPRFVAVLPHDIINGQPLKYRRAGNGRFILYSVGWNEKDDGGIVATNKDNHQDILQGDWVWQYPEGN